MLTFAEEPLSLDLWDEAMPLLLAHWREIAHYRDIALAPDIDGYQRMAEAGFTRTYTVRREGALVGYALFLLRPNLHYKSSLQAVQDVLYLDPSVRGRTGYHFIKWCDLQLRDEGVQVVYHHVKEVHNFGPMLERIGYELVDRIYARRLD